MEERKRNGWKITAILSLCCLLLVTAAFLLVFLREDYPYRLQRKFFGETSYKPSDFETYVTRGWSRSLEGMQSDIVFFGDSITCGGDWQKAFPDSPVFNFSVPADGVMGLAYRSFIVKDLAPEKVFLMVGINDMVKVNYDQLMAEDYRALVEDLQAQGVTVYIESILPVRLPCRYSNDRIRHANQILRQTAEDLNCTYIDLYPLYVDEQGEMRQEFTEDGLHPLPDAYGPWIEAVRPYVE